MVDKKLLDILCCPETKQDVTVADDGVITKLNENLGSGEVVNRGGKVVKDAIEAGLVRADGKYLYPIRDGIPIMLIDEAIALTE